MKTPPPTTTATAKPSSRKRRKAKPRRTGNPPGRPTKLTAAVIEAIAKHVADGNYVETAAAACGVAPSTVRDWQRRGRTAPGPSLLRRFYMAMLKAAAMAEANDVMLIGKAAEKDWRAAAFRLTHRYGSRWRTTLGVDPSSAPDDSGLDATPIDPRVEIRAKLRDPAAVAAAEALLNDADDA